jgi:RNA polymerase sigma factor (sigma-70 family)
MQGHSIDDESEDTQRFTLEKWYRTIEEVQSLGVEWLGPAEPNHQFDLCDLREKTELINRALADLPRRKRLALLLHYVRGLSVKEIATRLNIAESHFPQLRFEALVGLRAAAVKRLRSPRHENGD